MMPAQNQQQVSRRLHLVHMVYSPTSLRNGGRWWGVFDLVTSQAGKTKPMATKANDHYVISSPMGTWAVIGAFGTDEAGLAQEKSLILMLQACNYLRMKVSRDIMLH